MAYTRSGAETVLVGRLRAKMVMVGFAVTTAGSNADLNDPFAVALRRMGVAASSPVVDADIAGLTADQYDEFVDRAELRLLQSIVGNIDLTDISVGPRRESLGQLADQCEKAIARLEKSIANEWGAGLSGLETGSLTLDFQQKSDDEDLTG
jgi:hypothetical protein